MTNLHKRWLLQTAAWTAVAAATAVAKKKKLHLRLPPWLRPVPRASL